MIVVTANQINIEETINSLRHPDCGAIMSYLGTVRSYLEDRQSKGLSFEVTDREMEQSLHRLEDESLQKFDIKQVAIIHRTGSFNVGGDILLIAISAGHRGPAFEACAWLIDRIKELHEGWKREELVR